MKVSKEIIKYLGDKKYIIKGCYELIGTDLIRITELPVGTWTEDYKAFLESLMDDKDKKKGKSKIYVKSYRYVYGHRCRFHCKTHPRYN